MCVFEREKREGKGRIGEMEERGGEWKREEEGRRGKERKGENMYG